MSLLDKLEVQDICEHIALLARKWSGFICKRVSEDTTLSRYIGLLKKEEEEEEECQIAIFYFAWCVRKLRCDVIHSFNWKSAIKRDGGVKNA